MYKEKPLVRQYKQKQIWFDFCSNQGGFNEKIVKCLNRHQASKRVKEIIRDLALKADEDIFIIDYAINELNLNWFIH